MFLFAMTYLNMSVSHNLYCDVGVDILNNLPWFINHTTVNM